MSTGDGAGGTKVVAIRGAIDAAADTPDDIKRAVTELVGQINTRNGVAQDSIISAQFTMTADLCSVFPASVARDVGWSTVPMLCAVEIDVPGALPRCIRVLVHASIASSRKPEHVYLGAAAALRPDLKPAAARG